MHRNPIHILPEELEAHQGWMGRLARSLVASQDVADDVLQETWLAALRHRALGRALNPAWLSRVLRNLAAQRFRRESARSRLDQGQSLHDPEPSAAETVERIEAHRVLTEAVLSLEEPYRETVLLRYFHDLPPAEIARRQQAPPGTVRSRLKRGLDALRTRLDTLHEGDEQGWVVALAPILRTQTSATALAGGVVTIMGISAKTGFVAAVALAAVVGVWIVRSPEEDSQTDTVHVVESASEPSAEGNSGLLLSGEQREALVDVTPPAPPSPWDEQARVRVVGRVLDQASGLPVQEAAVWLGRGSYTNEAVPEEAVRTGEDGRFMIEKAYRRFRTLLVWSDDHALLTKDIEKPAQVEVERNGIDLGDLRLVEGAVVRGLVSTHDGVPVSDALLLLHEVISTSSFFPSSSRPVGRTQEDGTFIITHVPPSPHKRSRMFAVSPRGWGCAEFTVVHAQDRVDAVAIRLFPNRTLLVLVVDEDSEPIEGARVSAIPISEPFVFSNWSYPEYAERRYGGSLWIGSSPEIRSLLQASTDESGRATLSRLPASFPHTVRVEAPGFLKEVHDVVRLGADLPTELQVHMRKEQRRIVAGRVVTREGSPLPGARVRKYTYFQSSWSQSQGETVTDSKGHFDFADQEAGHKSQLVVVADGFAMRPHPIEVPVDEDLIDVELVVQRSVPILGVVVDGRGQPVAGVHTVLRRDADSIWSDQMETGEDGSFSFPNATEGEWTLSVKLPKPRGQWEQPSLKLQVVAGRDPVQVVAVRGAPGIATLVAEIVDSRTGLPVAPTDSGLGTFDGEGERPRRWKGGGKRSVGQVKYDGVEAGRWQLHVECDGYLRAVEEFNVDPAATSVHLRVEMRQLGMVTGHVVLGGLAVPTNLGVHVDVHSIAIDTLGNKMEGVTPRCARLRNTLEFRFIDVDPVSVTFTLDGGDLVGHATVDVKEGATTTAVIRAELGGRIRTRGGDRHPAGHLRVYLYPPKGPRRTLSLASPETPGEDGSAAVYPGQIRYVVRARPHAVSYAADEDIPMVAEGFLSVSAGQTVELQIPPPVENP